MHIFLYGRASTDKQQLTLEAQRARCEAWVRECQARGEIPADAIVTWCPDPSVTSRIDFHERPQGEAIYHCMSRGDVLVITQLDRAFRSTKDFVATVERLEEARVRFVVTTIPGMDTGTPVGKLVLTILAAVAEFERTMISVRTREALAARKRKRGGRPHISQPPHGWMHPSMDNYGRRPMDKLIPDKRGRLLLVEAWKRWDSGISPHEVFLQMRREGYRRRQHEQLEECWLVPGIEAAANGFPGVLGQIKAVTRSKYDLMPYHRTLAKQQAQQQSERD